MNNVKVLAINREKIVKLGIFASLLSIALVVPLSHRQNVTGPVVNATLFITTSILGTQAGILVGLIPSVVALSAGLLPPVLAPMVPFIMIGNTILILSFDALKNKNYWISVATSSFLKFIFLYATSSVVVNLLLKKDIAQQVVIMMSWPQLVTAIAGGVLAYLFLKNHK